MELFGIPSIILGIIGMIVMLKGKRPQYPSSPIRAKLRRSDRYLGNV